MGESVDYEQKNVIDVFSPRWDQSIFINRLKHFASLTDPRTIWHSNQELMEAKQLVHDYAANRAPPTTTLTQVYEAQRLYFSAFHPDSGELQNVAGRMSFQMYGGTALCAAMMIFYRSNSAVMFWQWSNQSFNALVNYTNRNAKSELTTTQIGVAYVSATTAALVTALGLKAAWANTASSLAQRFVPYFAVAASNCVNIPLMRQNELRDGLDVLDAEGRAVCKSKLAAVKGISLVTISRVGIVTPVMLLTPMLMARLEKAAWFAARRRFLNIPIQLALTAAQYSFMIPLCCALFPQKSCISMANIERFEPSVYAAAKVQYESTGKTLPKYVYFNKGL